LIKIPHNYLKTSVFRRKAKAFLFITKIFEISHGFEKTVTESLMSDNLL